MIKKQFIYLASFAVMVLMGACKKDNYDPPSTTLSGRLVYQGQPFGGVERNQVPFEFYQYGFGKVGPIGQTFAEDGTYTALLFAGDYKLIVPNGQGPFLWPRTASGAPDSIAISLTGNQTLDLEVTPYYIFTNPQIAASGGSVNATFGLQKIITDSVNGKNIENVELYINKTQFVSGGNNIGVATIGGGDITDMNNIALSVAIPSITPTQNYVFARIGVKLVDVEDRLFSPLVKLEF